MEKAEESSGKNDKTVQIFLFFSFFFFFFLYIFFCCEAILTVITYGYLHSARHGRNFRKNKNRQRATLYFQVQRGRARSGGNWKNRLKDTKGGLGVQGKRQGSQG